MTAPMILNNVDHAALRVHVDHDPAFGDAVNQSLLLPIEFEAAQRDYPILFRRRDEGGYYAVALLGLDPDENLFLNGRRWQAGYVPIAHQRGPFAIAMNANEQGEVEPMLQVDLDSPRVAADGEGVAVFLPNGGHSPYLDHVVRTLRRAHQGLAVEAAMFAAFESAGLIRPITMQIAVDDYRRYDVPDCFAIDGERLASLDGATLEALHRPGFLNLAFLALSSLGNVPRLIELKNARERAVREQQAA